MSSFSHHNATALSAWIFRGLLLVAIGLVVAGIWLMNLEGRRAGTSSLDESDSSQQTSHPSQPSTVAYSGHLPDATAVDWANYMPAGRYSDTIERVMHRFGRTMTGPIDAPVTIIEFGAYGCTSCRMVHQSGMLNDLLNQYPHKIRLVFVAWPVIHSNDKLAAEASLCALAQGRTLFWAYHDALFSLSNETFDTYTHPDPYIDLAAEITHFNQHKFETCLREGYYREVVFDLLQAGMDLELRGTPTFVVNGQLVHAYDLAGTVEAILAPDLD